MGNTRLTAVLVVMTVTTAITAMYAHSACGSAYSVNLDNKG